MIDENTLLDDIIRYCERHNLAPSAFGERATRDRGLVTRLRQGKSPTLRTVGRLYDYMEKNP